MTELMPLTVSQPVRLKCILAVLILVFGLTAGCRTPEAFRREVDTHARQIITQTRSQVLDTDT
ncbi:MAG: hypothetical protein AB1Z38_03455, partial [Desulfotignum sp.]